MANVSPLGLYRKRAVITAYERYKRLEKNSPLGMMVNSWQEQHRIKIRSFMHHALDLCEEIGFSVDRMPLRGVGFPPHFSSYLP